MNNIVLSGLCIANLVLLLTAIVWIIEKIDSISTAKIEVMLDKDAFEPEKAYESDAGFDLRTPEEFTLPAHGNYAVDTGVHMLIPKGFCGLLVSKSGLYIVKHISSTGLVDSFYSGSIKVGLENKSDTDIHFNRGDKVSQITILSLPEVRKSTSVEFTVSDNARGNNGLGSTGR